jgi:hypothetical protein
VLDVLLDKNGQATDAAPGSGHVVQIPVPQDVDAARLDEFAMLVRYLPRESAAQAVA